MAVLSDLFKWKKQVTIKQGGDKEDIIVWMRILGDYDLSESYKLARVESAKIRVKMKDVTSDEYLNETTALAEYEDSELKQLVISTKSNDFFAKAIAVVNKGELPKMEDIALEPDAPTLAEQEKYDAALKEVTDEYTKEINDYITARSEELDGILSAKSHEELWNEAVICIQNFIPERAFTLELNNQKVYRATYQDEYCKIRAFESIDDYKNASNKLRQQLISDYTLLELSSEDIKN